jgi:hypothetical protein
MRTRARVLSSRCAWCRECCRRAAFGVAVAVVTPCVVLWLRSPCHVGVAGAVVAPRVVSQSRSRSMRHVGVTVAAVAPHGCCGCRRCAAWVLRSPSLRRVCCAACGVAGAVVAPRGCRGRRLCAACVAPRVVSRVQSLRRVGVAGAVFAPRVLHHVWCRGCRRCAAWVSQVPSLRRVWCCSCCRRAARGIAGAVVGLHGVAVVVAVDALRECRGCGHCAVCGSPLPFLCHVWCRGHGRRAVWCCGRGGCRRAARCRSHGRCRHVVTGPQKRKLVEKRKKKTYQQADAVRAATSASCVVTTFTNLFNYLISESYLDGVLKH